MRIPINTDVLKKHNLTLGQYIILLASYYNIDYEATQRELAGKGLIEKNLFSDFPPIISNNTKELIAKIMVDSDDKLLACGISDFDALAKTLQSYYPDGIKPGKTYPWRGKADDVAQRLKILVAKYDFSFTEEEAIHAVQEYISSFQSPYTYMHTLQNFILFTKKDNGKYEMESIFMTIIENNR